MQSNSVCNYTSDSHARRTAKQESDLLLTRMITNRVGRNNENEWRELSNHTGMTLKMSAYIFQLQAWLARYHINNGNRTKWSPIRSANIGVTKKADDL